MIKDLITKITGLNNSELIHNVSVFIQTNLKNESKRLNLGIYYFGVVQEQGKLKVVLPPAEAKQILSDCDKLYTNKISDIFCIEQKEDGSVCLFWSFWDEDGEVVIYPNGGKQIISYRNHEQWRKTNPDIFRLAREFKAELSDSTRNKKAA